MYNCGISLYWCVLKGSRTSAGVPLSFYQASGHKSCWQTTSEGNWKPSVTTGHDDRKLRFLVRRIRVHQVRNIDNHWIRIPGRNMSATVQTTKTCGLGSQRVIYGVLFVDRRISSLAWCRETANTGIWEQDNKFIRQMIDASCSMLKTKLTPIPQETLFQQFYS